MREDPPRTGRVLGQDGLREQELRERTVGGFQRQKLDKLQKHKKRTLGRMILEVLASRSNKPDMDQILISLDKREKNEHSDHINQLVFCLKLQFPEQIN